MLRHGEPLSGIAPAAPCGNSPGRGRKYGPGSPDGEARSQAKLQTKANLEAEPLLPTGSSIKIDAGNAIRYGDLSSASVPATVSGPRYPGHVQATSCSY